MVDQSAQQREPRRRGMAGWLIASILLGLALLAALAMLFLREPDVVIQQVPSTQETGPTRAMLDEVARLDAETEALTDDMISVLVTVADYECPPGTAPKDVERLNGLKQKAVQMLALAGVSRPAPTVQPPAPVEPQPQPQVAPLPAPQVPATPEAQPGDRVTHLATSQLRTLMENAVVFILPIKDGQVPNSGTGFFISPNLIATNRHVIEKGDPSTIIITNAALGDVVIAQVIASSPPGKPGEPDFALLRTERPVAPAFIPLTGQHNKLLEILVAGYPGMALGTDAGFKALTSGDRSAAPDMHQNRGEIRSTQDLDTAVSIIHTADVQSGYSGGPLIDNCGRAVGINTFIQVDAKQSAKFNSALSAGGLHRFLQSHGADHVFDTKPCEPR